MTRLSIIFKKSFTSYLQKGSFLQNVIYSISGNALALGLGFIFTPFLARIYTPEVYGIFAVFLVFVQNLGSISTLQYAKALLIPDSSREYRALLQVSLFLPLLICSLGLALFYFVQQPLLELFNGQSLSKIILLVPVAAFFIGIYDVIRLVSIKLKAFKRNSIAQVASTLSAKSSSLLYGTFLFANVYGLAIGELILRPVHILLLYTRSFHRELTSAFQNVSVKDLLMVLKKYRSFPFFVLPRQWLGVFSVQLPALFLISFFSASVVGNYSFANTLLNIPMSIFAGALAPVFLQKAKEVYTEAPEKLSGVVIKLFYRLFYVGILPFSFFIIFGEYIFTIVLGDQWLLAGEFAAYMGFYFVFWIVSSSLNPIYNILNKEKHNTAVVVVFTGINALALYIGAWGFNDPFVTVFLFSITNAIGHLTHILLIFRFLNIRAEKIILKPIMWFVISLAGMYGLKILALQLW